MPPTAYVDTMIFVYSSLSTGYLGRKSNAFLQDIEEGNFRGVVATITISEYLAITKKTLYKRLRRRLTSNEIEAILAELERLLQDLGVAVYDTDDLVVNQFGNSTLFSEAEDLVRYSPCRFGKRNGKVHTLCGADALSVVLAKRIGANLYATFDDDFKDVKNGIKPLMIGEKY